MARRFGQDAARVRAGAGFSAVLVVVILIVGFVAVGPARGQVNTAPYPTSYIDINSGYNGAYPYSGGWGAWFAHQGSNGTATATFDPFSKLLISRIDVNMLHAGYHNVAPTTGVINKGMLEFTTINPNTVYTIDGVLPLNISTAPGASASVNCWLTLSEVGGPTLASYLVNQNFSGPPVSTIAFDATSPVSGAQTGTLLPSTTYRMEWFWQVGMTHNGSPTSNIDIAAGNPSFFQISLVPEPATPMLLALAGCAAALRRRRR